MKSERELIALSKTHTLEAIAEQFQRPLSLSSRRLPSWGFRSKGARRRGNDRSTPSWSTLDAYRRRYVAQATDFWNESTVDCSKDETLHRSYPIANFPF